MTAAVETEQLLAGIACHCTGDEHGHVPGSAGCAEAPIKSRTPRPFSAGPTYSSTGARGTCPGCGARQVARRISVRGHGSHIVDRGIEIACEIRIAEHTVKGGTCPGGVPTETTFRSGTEVAGWIAAHGEHTLERKVSR